MRKPKVNREELVELLNLGKSAENIAEENGISRQAIYANIRRWKIKKTWS